MVPNIVLFFPFLPGPDWFQKILLPGTTCEFANREPLLESSVIDESVIVKVVHVEPAASNEPDQLLMASTNTDKITIENLAGMYILIVNFNFNQ
jgi:hypothetical protein